MSYLLLSANVVVLNLTFVVRYDKIYVSRLRHQHFVRKLSDVLTHSAAMVTRNTGAQQ